MSESNNFAQIKRAEIFASGTWNGLSFSDDDLDGIVKSFDALGLAGAVPLKLGHEGPDVRDDPTTQFAMGWVQRVWREGRKLFADLDVPQKVQELIDQGFLKFVSVELLKNVKASNREIPWVLDAVALLGSDPPAVGVLKELRAFGDKRRADSFPHSACVTFSRADYLSTFANGGNTKMSDKDTPTLQEMMDKLLSLSNRMNEVEAENATLKREKAQFSQTAQRLKDMEASNAKRDRDERRSALRAEFDRAIANEDIVPAARERFWKTYSLEDDEVVLNVTVEDAREFIRENPSPLPKRKPTKTQFTLDRPDGDVPAGTRADDEALLRARAHLKAQNIHAPTWEQLAQATKEVFASNPQLGERYKFLPDTRAQGAH
jgi:hypothetical protein